MKKKKFYREDLPKLFNKKNLIGVELGVARGDFSQELMKSNKFKILFGIDSYSLNQHNADEYKFALKKLGIFSNYKLINMSFDKALDLFPDKSLDFIYFDGYAHTGQNYGQTILDWSKKIKLNGILSGDDYDTKWELNKLIIDQFALQNNFKLFVTDFDKKKHIYSSWYIKVNKKIKRTKFNYSKLLKYKEIIKSTKLYIPSLKKP
tara:strand:- start:747 stop:1364 length:618 start_codon:yes stop_codon:yes gene_type:complete